MNIDRTFLKKLWNKKEVICPKCNKEILIPLHKHDTFNWICPNCKEIYRTIRLLNKLLDLDQKK